MTLGSAKRRRIRRKFFVVPQGRPNSEINVTPLVDVVLVLLIIFMVVTPLMEKDLDVRVPQSEQVESVSELPPDQLLVSLDAKGTLALNREQVGTDEYVEKLRQVLAARAPGDRLVFFDAHDDASYALLVSALDGARAAGATTLGMTTEPPRAPTSSPAPGAGARASPTMEPGPNPSGAKGPIPRLP